MCNCNGSCGGNCKCKEEFLYPITFTCEDSETVLVHMTEEEASILNRVLREAVNNLSSNYCGTVSVDINGKISSH